jgi:tetratricopeptide (TPR) repeat protein
MAKERVISLDAVRTDGWFERIGEGIGSFQALCEIVGEAFFAFSMITGARITALTVDRRNPNNSLIDFIVGAGDEEDGDVQRLTLSSFRQRLVDALVAEDVYPAPPQRDADIEGLQLHVGVRYLLLAPVFGYSMRRLLVQGRTSRVVVAVDGIEDTYELDELRARIHGHLRDELERASAGAHSAIDLSKVAEAELAAREGAHARVIAILGSWPSPLAVFLRTAEGQSMNPEARALIARGLGLLGSACIALGDLRRGEEILRLGIQYAHDGVAASDVFCRLGEALLANGREGEAIGPLRRAQHLGASPRVVWPLLARAFAKRRRWVAALACIREASRAGVADAELDNEIREVEHHLGPALIAFRGHVRSADA